MPFDRIHTVLETQLRLLKEQGTAKGKESVITGVVPAKDGRGPRYTLAGEGKRPLSR